MTSIFRSLILWLALLAVPFQGFASATMLPCAPAAPAPHAAHEMATDGQHDHAAMSGQHANSHASPGDTDAKHHHATAKCGSCTACIGGALAPAPAVAFAAPRPPSIAVAFDDGHMSSVHPTLPDRPPRSSLA